MKAIYTAILTPRESGSGYFCRVPDLPGCITDGDDLQEAIEMIEDAANVWLMGDEDTAPQPTPQDKLDIPADAYVTLVSVDTIAYRAKMDTRSVKKTVSLPAWMAKMASEKGINCSKVLQDGLLHALGA